METEQFPEHPLAAEGIADGDEVDERGVGVGGGGNGRQQPGRDRRQEMPAPSRGQKPHLLLAEALECPMRGRNVAEPVPRQHLADECLWWRRIEHQVDLRLGLSILREGVVQQVVEDATIHVGRLGQFLAQPIGGRLACAVAHTHRQPGKLRRIPGHHVRLAIVEDLKPMLDGAQERVGAFQNTAFLVGQSARLRKPPHCLERRARADLRRVAAAQELEELNRELDVADPAPAALDVGVIGPVANGPVFDPSLERLDAADVGTRQPAAVDPRLHLGEHPPSQGLIAGDAPGLYPRLPLPGAAVAVVILEHRLLRHGRRSGRPVGPQPQVDAVGDPQVGRLHDQPHRLLHNPLEELGICTGLGSLHAAVGRIHEHEVDVAGIVQLQTAELAQRDHRDGGVVANEPAGDAPELLQSRHSRRDRRLHHAVGDVRNLRHHRLQPLPADDVAVGDAERLATFEAPQRPHHAVRLGEQGCLRRQCCGQALAALGPPLAHADLLPRLRIEDHQFGEIGAGREELEQYLQAPRITLEERAGGEGAADGTDETFHRDEHPIGIARGRE